MWASGNQWQIFLDARRFVKPNRILTLLEHLVELTAPPLSLSFRPCSDCSSGPNCWGSGMLATHFQEANLTKAKQCSITSEPQQQAQVPTAVIPLQYGKLQSDLWYSKEAAETRGGISAPSHAAFTGWELLIASPHSSATLILPHLGQRLCKVWCS